jgi:hypothetical protein
MDERDRRRTSYILLEELVAYGDVSMGADLVHMTFIDTKLMELAASHHEEEDYATKVRALHKEEGEKSRFLYWLDARQSFWWEHRVDARGLLTELEPSKKIGDLLNELTELKKRLESITSATRTRHKPTAKAEPAKVENEPGKGK